MRFDLTWSPSLRGPAPIHRAILRGDTHIGVTLQTLDDKAFDHGTILAQTPAPGIPIAPEATLQDVYTTLAKEGAQILVRSLREQLYVPPVKDASWTPKGGELVHAPKVTKADAQINWLGWTAEDFRRRRRVFGALWTMATRDDGEVKRVIFQDLEVADAPQEGEPKVMVLDGPDGEIRVKVVAEKGGSCRVQVREGLWLGARRVKVDGKNEQDAAVALRLFLRTAE